MSNLKKIIAVLTALTVVSWVGGPALGTTAEELQAQIDALLAQISALQAQLAALQGGTTTGQVPAACVGVTFDRNLKIGMTGSDVKCLQALLNTSADTKVADTGAGSPGNETSYFGPLTKAAVIKFQEKYADDVLASWGLTSGTGFVGSTTRAKLNSILSSGTTAGEGEDGGTAVTGEGLTVALADDTPAAATIVADSTSGDGAQSMVPMVKVKFSNGDSSDVKVTEVKFKRGGISADSDISQAYLYDGDTLLAEYTSYSTGILTFSNSSGLFTVPAGQSKVVTLKVDLANGTSAGKTLNFSVLSADDVVSDASAVNGTFPLTGNLMSTAVASDLGKLTVASTTAAGSAVDPQTGLEVYNFTLAAADQKVEVRKIKFTNIGSTAYNDLNNFQLLDGATVLGTVDEMNTDKTVTFDLTASPLVIDKGVTKYMHLKADIVGGTNRTFQFSIQEITDITAYDTGYGVYIRANQADSWDISKTRGDSSTINTGKLTVTRASDSPSGNVARSGTNVTLAKFDVKAAGENVKISQLDTRIYGTIGTDGFYQVKIYFDGSQKGTTKNASTSATDAVTGDTTFTFGNTFIVPADGETHTLEVKGDIKKEDGTAADADDNFTVVVRDFEATGKTSLASVSVAAASGYQLTVKTGSLSAAVSQAVGDWTVTNPTAVPGQTEALVGVFTVTAGASEGADVTAVKLSDQSSSANLQNLKVYKGTKDTGTQIGLTRSSVSTNTNYTFYPSPYISLSANEQAVLYVYADVKTSVTTSSNDYIKLVEVDGVGKTTNTSVNWTTGANGQKLYIADKGSLAVTLAADTPVASQLMAGDSEDTFLKAKLVAGAAEDMEVTYVQVTADLGATTPTSTVSNLKLYDGDTLLGTVAALDSQGKATFNLTANPWVVPASQTKYLTVKADVGLYPYATSGGTVALKIATSTTAGTGITYKGATSGGQATTTSVIQGKTMYTYRTRLKIAKASNSPSGAGGAPSQNAHLLYFTLENEGDYSAYFNAATFTISFTPLTATTAASGRYFYIYKSTDLTTKLATGTITGTTTINDETIEFDITPDLEIAPNTTETFYLIGDTRDATVTSGSTSGSIVQMSLADGTDLDWDDGLVTTVSSALTKTTPLYGGTIQY